METIAAKLAGTIAGAFLALVLIPPRTKIGFFRRLTAAIVSGPIFGPVVLHYTQWEGVEENIIAASCLAALISWWGLGVLINGTVKVMEKWFSVQSKPE